ncbi:MAG: PBP1A family penicillin-binding protein [Alphaproteobacteria bacterium]|nr:PBP1A family penicillin-binding protein [Alphaproteobacteria bacterium]MDE1967271.1 PBP1A family penicillin-binding protein [Alphaproteobacteria bacterium]MDE2512620.1 PBP1A family penicillin-binding protein [Alphaproteobacteria bacterium]
MTRLDKDQSRGGRRPRGPRKPSQQSLGRWLAFAALWAFLAGGGVLAYFALTLPSTDQLTAAQRQPSVTVLADDGSFVATFGELFGEPLRLREMPHYLPEAVIATEDRRFYHHFGIDLIGMARALFADLRARHIVQGGSTITQQLAKNLFLTPDRTIGRKIRETMLALWLEHQFTKNQILELYLNRVYLGAGTYGVDAAAHRYFNKSARDLTLYEAAVIAGLLKAPSRFSPVNDRALAADRADQVLQNMVDAGYITDAQAHAAERQKSQLATADRAPPGSRYFADWVASQIGSFADINGHDVIVATTLDPKMQTYAEHAVARTLATDGAADHVTQGALVAMSPDGAIRAMVGGSNYNESQFNRATQAERQPGSSFKPFVYLTALEHGIKPTDVFNDAPVRIGNWEPHNYENTYRGNVTVADAIAYSINTVAAQVIDHVGAGNVIAVARRLGITTPLPDDDSLALGTGSVTLMELTSAYAAFASGGVAAWPHAVLEIRDTHGNVLYHRAGSGAPRVIDANVAGEMNELLEGVIQRGTGRAASLDRPDAGKTGTTQDFRDALFVGYTADLVCGVWFGNDDNSPMKHVTGGTLPARTWHAFMADATRDMPVRDLPGPNAFVALDNMFGRNAPPPPPSGGPPPPNRPGILQSLMNAIFGSR